MDEASAVSGVREIRAASKVLPQDVYVGIAHDGVTGAACAISEGRAVLDAALFSKTLLGFGEDVATFLRGQRPSGVVIVGGAQDLDAARRIGRLEGITYAVTRHLPSVVKPIDLCRHLAAAHRLKGSGCDADEIAKRLAPAAYAHASAGGSSAWRLALLAALVALDLDF